MRILFIQETNWIDRNVIHQHHLAERLVQRGHHVRVIDYDILWQHRQHSPLWLPRQEFKNINKVLEGISVISPLRIK